MIFFERNPLFSNPSIFSIHVTPFCNLNSNSWVFNLAAVLPSNFLETPSTSHELLLAKRLPSTIFTGWLTRIPPLRPGSFCSPCLTQFGHQFPSYLSSRIELINIHSGFRAKTQKKGEECTKCEIDAIHSWKTHENIIGFCAKRLDTRRLIGFFVPRLSLVGGNSLVPLADAEGEVVV